MTMIVIDGWLRTSENQDGKELVVRATSTKIDSVCCKCGAAGSLQRHGTKIKRYRDVPHGGKTCVLDGEIQRYMCKSCGKTFVQIPDGVDEGHRMTTRCLDLIRSRLENEPYTHIAKYVGCSEGTVRRVASISVVDAFDSIRKGLVEAIDSTKRT